MRPMLLFVSVALVACGGPARTVKSVTVVPAAAASGNVRAVVTPQRKGFTLALSFEQKVPGQVRGIAVLGGRLYVEVAGKLQVWDARGPVASRTSSWRPGDPVIVVGDGAFDPVSFAPHAPAVTQGTHCENRAFSYDGSRMSASCFDSAGEEDVYVVDTKTGALVGVFKEFRTAAPIRSGTITSSGNFVFWQARATGAFEEIKSHVTGPPMSARSVMSRDERMLFTTVDRDWYTDDQTPAKVIDPKNGRELFQLGSDVDMAFFSPSSRLLAARHSANWADMAHGTEHDKTSMTIHEGAAEPVAKVPGENPVEAAFAPDDSELAVRFASGLVSVYDIRR